MAGLVYDQYDQNDPGGIQIANEVIAIIAGIAATEVKGVAGMSGGVVDGITELVRKKNMSKGVKVEVGDKEVAVDLYVVIEYGTKIPDVAYAIQENVVKAIESMTGKRVVEVNVHIQGIHFKPEEAEESRLR